MNKFNIILNETTRNIVDTTNSIVDTVKTKISDYLGFDINHLLFDTNDSAFVYGGAVRDSIANLPIHDIDIMTLPRAARALSQTLIDDFGFTQTSLASIDIVSLYFGIRVINLPWTFIKDDCIVQLIRPVIEKNESPHVKLHQCLSNVDLSCCGIAYRPTTIIETCAEAIDHCQQKMFKVLTGNLLYRKDRISHRVCKLEDRGWKEIQKDNRMKKEIDMDIITLDFNE